MAETLLTVSEAAAFRGVSRSAIYSAIARNILPQRYEHGHLVVSKSDLNKWQENKDQGGWPKGKPKSAEHKDKLRRAYEMRIASQKA